MLNYKHHVLTLLLLLSSVCMAQAATQEQMKSTKSFDYSKFTYQWTDAGGNTQTANLTDKATTTEQIMALLAEVYCNPRIPGIRYSYHYNGNNLGKVDYDGNASTAKQNWLGAYCSGTIETPDEGCTILLVEMKNDWTVKTAWGTTDAQYIAKCYESVQLLDKNKYIADSDNPGYLVSIDGISTNKFFFISKGRSRQDSEARPLYRLYEQISPVEYGNKGETVDFSSSIRNGDLYYMEHDCADVPTVEGGHEFTISKEGESYSFKNLTFFLPDRRFQVTEVDLKWSNNNFVYYKWKESADTYRPRNLMYLVTQNDPTLQAAGNNTYNVGLSWTTSFDDAKLGLDVPQTYYIYATVDGETKLLGTTDDIQNYQYSVPQRHDAYSITYTIVSSPMQSNITATSLTKTVVIPGMGTPFFMQGAKYRSRYEMDNQLNIYKNTLTVQASTESDYNNLSSVTTPYALVRTTAGSTDETVVANVTFSSDHSYKVEYVDDTQDYGNLFDSEVPVTEGTMDSHTATITFIDRFTVSTKTNEQPAGYSYVLRFGDQNSSNVCDVPVYKTTNSVSLHGVTKAQVAADTKHAVTEDQYTAITFTAISQASANVQDYTVFCDEQTHSHRSGKAEVSSTGTGSISYIAMGRNTTGAINVNQGTFAIDEGSTAQITVTDYQSTTPATRGYVPVVTTYYNGNSSEPNTYGCDIKNTALPSFTLSVTDEARTSNTWLDGNAHERTAYTATLNLKPTMNSVVPYVYYYRVWRVEPDGTETLLNTSKDIDGKGWTTTYSNIKDYYPSSSEATTTCDIYLGDVPAPTREVTYIARMYSTTTGDASTDANYYISEQRVTVTYDDSKIVTGVTQVTAGSPATSVTYYNLTGQPSATPWQGVNVAITRHADGTTTSAKVLVK